MVSGMAADKMKNGQDKMEKQEPEDSPEPLLNERLSELVERPFEFGHHIDTLVNGDRIFPPMLQTISEAQEEICFETFIYWSGEIAVQFATALADAARRGVKVLVLLDWWGAHKMEQRLIAQMREAGVTVRYFNPLRWWQLDRMNYRTHRKILVVDRKVAFTGGVGIAQEWLGDARSPDEWYDLHYRITGPVVRDLCEAFHEVWAEVVQQRAQSLDVNAPPPRTDQQTVAAQVMSSSPRRGSELIYLLFQHAINTATESLIIITAYFVPDDTTIASLIAAVERGIRIDVMVPGPHTDSAVVRYSSISCWGKLLRAGVRIHIYQPTMLHAKATIVDDNWVIIGSANFDNRSFSLNDEVIVNVFSEEFAAQHRRIFAQNCERSVRCSYEQWQSRGFLSRCKEAMSNLVRKQL